MPATMNSPLTVSPRCRRNVHPPSLALLPAMHGVQPVGCEDPHHPGTGRNAGQHYHRVPHAAGGGAIQALAPNTRTARGGPARACGPHRPQGPRTHAPALPHRGVCFRFPRIWPAATCTAFSRGPGCRTAARSRPAAHVAPRLALELWGNGRPSQVMAGSPMSFWRSSLTRARSPGRRACANTPPATTWSRWLAVCRPPRPRRRSRRGRVHRHGLSRHFVPRRQRPDPQASRLQAQSPPARRSRLPGPRRRRPVLRLRQLPGSAGRIRMTGVSTSPRPGARVSDPLRVNSSSTAA